MAGNQWLAVEWDRREARVLAVRGTFPQTTVEGAWAFPFPGGEQTGDADVAGRLLREALGAISLPGKTARAVASPGEVLLRHMKLPLAPEHELAGMVRFQSAHELSTAVENAAVDFLVLPRHPGEGQIDVLVAALPAPSLQEHRRVLEGSGLKAHQLLLRGPASGQALRELQRQRSAAPASSSEKGLAALLVDFTAEMACLTILADDVCVMTRSRRIPAAFVPPWVGEKLSGPAETVSGSAGEATREDFASYVAQEITRTLSAFHSQFPQRSVQHVFLAQDTQAEWSLAEAVQRALGRSVEGFDPFSLLHAQGDQTPLRVQIQRLPASQDRASDCAEGVVPLHGRFAALVGLVFESGQPSVDFFHPKEPTVTTGGRRRRAMAIAVGVAVLLAGFGIWYGFRTRAQRRDLAALQEAAVQLDKELAQHKEVEKVWDALQQWRKNKVNWLDEFSEITAQFPESKDAYVNKLGFHPTAGRVPPRVRIDALARSEAVVEQFAGRLAQDREHYRVQPGGVHKQPSGEFPWQFDADLLVTPLSTKQYAQRATQRMPTKKDQPASAANVSPKNETAAVPTSGPQSPQETQERKP